MNTIVLVLVVALLSVGVLALLLALRGWVELVLARYLNHVNDIDVKQ